MSVEIPSGVLWAILVVVAISAYVFRLSFFVLFGRIDNVPDWVDTTLNYVAPAVLAALVLPKLMYVDGGIVLANPRLVAGAIAGVVAWRTENVAATVVVGMVAFWGLRSVM